MKLKAILLTFALATVSVSGFIISSRRLTDGILSSLNLWLGNRHRSSRLMANASPLMANHTLSLGAQSSHHVYLDCFHAESRCSSNSYWVGLTGLTTDEMDVAFNDIANTGGTTVRTWFVAKFI
jgi:hypothetical protein